MNRLTVFVSIASFSISLYGCDIHDYVPNTDEILSSGSLENLFLVEGKNVRGVYGNSDVNCDVYSYETDSSSESVFWELLEKNLSNTEWTRITENESEVRRYVLLSDPAEPGYRWLIVEAGIGLNPSTKTVAVGFVFTYTRSKPDPVKLPSLEADFAEERIWPRINECISSDRY